MSQINEGMHAAYSSDPFPSPLNPQIGDQHAVASSISIGVNYSTSLSSCVVAFEQDTEEQRSVVT
jgi:hypothetical protein